MVGTFKIITMSTAIEEKVIDIYNDHFYDSGSVKINGTRIGCWKSSGHGDQTFLQVLENSCNLVEQQEILSIMKILLNFQRKNVVDIN